LLLHQQSENQEYHKAQVEGMSVVMEKVQQELRLVRTSLLEMTAVEAPGIKAKSYVFQASHF